MSRHDTLIIKDTHRGLLYEDGVFREVLPVGRFPIPRPPSAFLAFFGAKAPRVEVVMVDVRGRDRTVAVPELLTADGVTISASFVVQYRVSDPVAALHQVKNFDERLYSEVQTGARRVLRGMSVEEVLGGRDEIGEELLRQVEDSASLYGLEVTEVDFKDLIIPEELRKVFNRAVLSKRLRRAQFPDPLAIEDGEGREDDALVPAIEHQDADLDSEEEAGLIIARASFGRDRGREADTRSDGLPIRPFSLRRCQP